MIIKTVIIAGLIIVMNACAGNMDRAKNKTIVMPPLPQKCGRYNIVYGDIDEVLRLGTGEKRANNTFNLLFKDENDVSVDKDRLYEKYASKTLLYAMQSWEQTIGGLLYPDGSSGGIYRNTYVAINLIQVVEKGEIDMDNLEKECQQLKEK